MFKPKTGIQAEVNNQLAREAKLDELQEWKTYVTVTCDEMKIKEGLVYDKYTGCIMGFTDLGDTNKYLNELKSSMEKSSSTNVDIATSMLVFLVRGLFVNITFPYAQYPCR